MVSKIKAIIFDLGGVLINVNKEYLVKNLARHSSLSEAEIGKYFSDTVVMEHEFGFSQGTVFPEEFFMQMKRLLKLEGLNLKGFDLIYSGRLTGKPETIALLRKLSRRYDIGILSNNNILNYAKCVEILKDVVGLFKAVSLSYEVHSRKPEPGLYREVLRQLGLPPSECVYIDDVREYAEVATKLGMKGIQFTSVAKLETDLRKLGVSF